MSDPREDEDDAAFHWEGDEESGRLTSLDRPDGGAEPEPASPRAAQDAPAAPGARGARPRPDAPPPDRLLTVITAMFAVLFVAETVGWALVVQRVQSLGLFTTGSGVLDFVGGMARFFALVAAPIWFAGTVQLTRELRTRRRRMRIGWLSLGLGLLVPVPALLGLIG